MFFTTKSDITLKIRYYIKLPYYLVAVLPAITTRLSLNKTLFLKSYFEVNLAFHGLNYIKLLHGCVTGLRSFPVANIKIIKTANKAKKP